MMKTALFAALVLGFGTAAPAEVTLPAVFSDHMVLLKSERTPIWGKAAPGETITVAMNGQTARATAGPDGKWKVWLDLKNSKIGPFVMTVAGRNKITISDVVVGQPWLLIGQSNPERMLKESANAPAEAAQAHEPLIREFRLQKKGSDVPEEDVQGSWTVCSPATALNLSAIGYYFAKDISQELKQPVGILNGSWGGTFIEAWLSERAIDQDPDLRAGENIRLREMHDFIPEMAEFIRKFTDWLQAHGRTDRPCADPAAYADPHVSTADWTPVNLPGKIAGPNLPLSGAVWIRREVEVPASVQGLVIKPSLGVMTGYPEVYWNGAKIYEMPYRKIPGEDYTHYFPLPQQDVVPGKATLAIRIYAPVLPPEIVAAPARFIIGPIHLAGRWMAKAEYSLPPLSPLEAASAPVEPHQPPGPKASVIFNGVINPVIPYGLAGIIWYQGESNTGTAYQYRTSFPLFINDLRERWNEPDLPFYFCQLTNYLPKVTRPGESSWAELRESQSLALKLPHTAQAVLIDVGESDAIHARNKKAVGDRLARMALALDYGETKVIYSGPVYQSMSVVGSKVWLSFTHTEGGLVAKPLPSTYDVDSLLNETAPLVPNSPGSQLEGFAVCGDDHRWVWADAKIKGNRVLVWSDQVPAPVAVRYDWSDNPNGNLYNGGDLPASPFRTDNFPVSTQNDRFGLPSRK